jgi:hypothetical protein
MPQRLLRQHAKHRTLLAELCSASQSQQQLLSKRGGSSNNQQHAFMLSAAAAAYLHVPAATSRVHAPATISCTVLQETVRHLDMAMQVSAPRQQTAASTRGLFHLPALTLDVGMAADSSAIF